MTDITVETIISVFHTATGEDAQWLSDWVRYGPAMADKLAAAARIRLAWSMTATEEEYDDSLNDGTPDPDYCLGRIVTGEYPMYMPIVFSVDQCHRAPLAGGDLCAVCARRKEKYPFSTKPGPWHGKIGEERMGWAHLFGTEWAEARIPRRLK